MNHELFYRGSLARVPLVKPLLIVVGLVAKEALQIRILPDLLDGLFVAQSERFLDNQAS